MTKKKSCAIMVFVLGVCLLAGCGGGVPDDNATNEGFESSVREQIPFRDNVPGDVTAVIV